MCCSEYFMRLSVSGGTLLVLTVVDEMCFFSISAQRQTSGLTTCAEYPFARMCHAAEFRRKGRRSPSTATPRGRPPQTWNEHDPPHTTEGPPQARQAAAYPIRCSFPPAANSGSPKGRLCSGHTCRQRSDVTLLGRRGHNGCECRDTFINVQSCGSSGLPSPSNSCFVHKTKLEKMRRCAASSERARPPR